MKIILYKKRGKNLFFFKVLHLFCVSVRMYVCDVYMWGNQISKMNVFYKENLYIWKTRDLFNLIYLTAWFISCGFWFIFFLIVLCLSKVFVYSSVVRTTTSYVKNWLLRFHFFSLTKQKFYLNFPCFFFS